MKKITFKITFLVIIIFTITIYCYQFHGNLSNNSNDWSAFGSYIGGTIGTILGIINLWLIIQNNIETRKLEQIKTQPVVNLYYAHEDNSMKVSIKNIGLAPALLYFKKVNVIEFENNLSSLYLGNILIYLIKDDSMPQHRKEKFIGVDELIHFRDTCHLTYTIINSLQNFILSSGEELIFFEIKVKDPTLVENGIFIFSEFSKRIRLAKFDIEYQVQDFSSNLISDAKISSDGVKLIENYNFVNIRNPIKIETNLSNLLN